MSIMIEVYYKQPESIEHEQKILSCVSDHQGGITCREGGKVSPVCLTIEFPNWESADHASLRLKAMGEHVEGPMDYGDD